METEGGSAVSMSGRELREIEKRAQAATKGPWYVLGPPWNDGNGFVLAGSDDPHQAMYVCNCDDDLMLDEEDDRGSANALCDSEFIARARQDIPNLLNEVRRSHAENAKLRQKLSVYENVLDHYGHLNDAFAALKQEEE